MIIIIEKKYCSGCHACSAVCPKQCINMEKDQEGFLYPSIDIEVCIDCGRCKDTCPINKEKNANHQEPEGYAAYISDDETRLKSSSGGMFPLLAEYIIEQNGVVFGAGFNDLLEVVHLHIETTNQIPRLQGSKYVQSKMGNNFQEVRKFLEEGRMVLFTGTPCQIAGLKSFLNKEYLNLITQDIICHGVPSPYIWNLYMNAKQQSTKTKLKEVSFRDKTFGWRKYAFCLCYEDNKKHIDMHSKNTYFKGFLANLFLRPSCHACHFKTASRVSDITLADFWGIQHVVPEMDDDKGTSLVFIHSDKGQNLFFALKNYFVYKPIDTNQAIKFNRAAIVSARQHPKRTMFFQKVNVDNIERLINQYCRPNLKKKLKKMISIILTKTGLKK